MPHQLAVTLENPLRLAYRNPGETLGLYGFRRHDGAGPVLRQRLVYGGDGAW